MLSVYQNDLKCPIVDWASQIEIDTSGVILRIHYACSLFDFCLQSSKILLSNEVYILGHQSFSFVLTPGHVTVELRKQ